MKKIDSRKDAVEAAAKRLRRKAYLKTGIALIATIAICGWAAYGLLNPRLTERYNDFAVDSAVDWLENADHDKFDICSKNITNADGWFSLYKRDRKSLGKIRSRSLSTREELPGAGSGLKRYELKFGTSFSESPRDVLEQVIVESDNHSRFTVINASHWPYFFRPSKSEKRILTDDEKQRIKTVADNVLKKIAARDTAFFKQAYTGWTEQPDYFHRKNEIATEAVAGKIIASLYEIMGKGKMSPWKLGGINAFLPVGRSGFECSSAYYSFSVNSEGKARNFVLQIVITRDLYMDRLAEWKFFSLWFWERKEKKK